MDEQPVDRPMDEQPIGRPYEPVSARRAGTRWLLVGALITIVLLVGAVVFYAQTQWGNQQILSLTLQLASRRLDGELLVQRLEGNVLTGARLYGVALRGDDGEPFLLADSAFIEYSLRTLAGGRIVIDRLEIYNGEVFLRRLPGERFWNYQAIFGDTLPPVDPPPERAPVALQWARVVNGLAVVQVPWEPEEGLTEAARQRAIEEALADTSMVVVTRVPGGFLQTYRFSALDGEVSEVVIAGDEHGGNYARLDRLSGIAQIWRQPVQIQRVEGEIGIVGEQIEFRAPVLLLPESRLTAYGVLYTRQERTDFDITIHGEQVTFADLQWLYPRFPDEGGGEILLTLESRPEGTLVVGRNLSLVAPGTRMSGQFGLILNDTLRFLESDLDAAPLSIPTIMGMLPTEVPVEGLRVGGVQIRAPAS